MKIKRRWILKPSEKKIYKIILFLILFSLFIVILSSIFNLFDIIIFLRNNFEYFQIHNIILALSLLSILLIIFLYRQWRELKHEKLARARAENRVHTSKSQLQAVLDGVPDIILQVDSNMRVLWANKAALDRNPNAIGNTCSSALGYTEGTFLDSTCLWAMDLGIIKKGITYQPNMIGVDGVSYWESIGVPLKNRENKIIGAIAIARDVTQRMRIEHTWNLLASIVESTDDAIYGVSWDGIILNWNPGAEHIYGFTSREVVGKSISIIIPLEYRQLVLDAIEKVMRKEQIERLETKRIKKNGEIIYVSQTICPFVDATGKKIGVSSIERDVTEIKHAEESLKESEERYRSFVQNFKGIAFRYRPDYKPIFIHGAVFDITGYNDTDFINNVINWEKIIFVDDINLYYEKKKISIINKEKDIEIEYRIQKKDGEIKWVQEISQNIFDSDGKLMFFQGTIYDITLRMQSDIELKKSYEQLHELAIHLQTIREEERKKIAFEIHDELGYALTALKLDLAWLTKKSGWSDKVLLERSKGMAQMLDTMIQKVRSISTQLRPSILDHFGLIAAIEWQSNEYQKRFAIRCKFTAEPPDIVIEEPQATAVFRIVQEALTNVARHAKATRIDINLARHEKGYMLTISDNGIGISEEGLTNKKSFGLKGMRERAKFLGGNIEIFSEKDLGTTIVLFFPFNNIGEKV